MSFQKTQQIDPEILSLYLPADNYCIINEDDPALHPIYIPMPKCPPLHKIDGYGLHPMDQVFVVSKMPDRLVGVVNSCDTIDEIWEEIKENPAIYYEEIHWIKKQLARRFYGYWCFINGKPTYFNGWNYAYLNFWRFMDGGLPDFRDRNRKFFHGLHYAYKATDIPEYDKDGIMLYIEREVNNELRSIPKIRDIGSRVLFGISYPKNRRDGATNMCLCAEYLETITRKGVVSGIISMNGKSAYDHFAEILRPGWQGMPFFFKPVHDGFDTPEEEIKFFGPKRKGSKSKAQVQLGSKINYSDTAQSTGYDRAKIFFMLLDEAGKTVEANVDSRHQILKNCVSQGNGSTIGGFMMYPSTVGEMKGSGGEHYYSLCSKSHWEQRGSLTGQTRSGLINIFFKSEEGLEGFVDPHGNSVVFEPTEHQILAAKRQKNWEDKYKYAVLGIGARQYLEERRKAFLEAGDMDGYNEEVRLFPQNFSEAFRTEDGDIGFNTVKLNARVDQLKFTYKKLVQKGTFDWEGGLRDGRVIWIPTEKGRWNLSMVLSDAESNQKYTENGIWTPINPRFTSSADPFKYNKTQGTRMSDGGGATFYNHDQAIDGQRDINHWLTHRFVCTYRNRPAELDDYCEDMLMQAVYFGAMMYPEINVDRVWSYFNQRGYTGYLLFDIDHKTGVPKNTPGFNSLEGSKQDLFNGVRDYIEKHIHREVHLDLIMEFKDIPGIEHMNKFDLFTAGAGCLRGTKSQYTQLIKKDSEKVDISSYFERRY